MTYNINGAKTKIASFLRQIAYSNIDAVLLQEIHHYDDGWSRIKFANLCRYFGWTALIGHASARDKFGGTAILINEKSRN